MRTIYLLLLSLLIWNSSPAQQFYRVLNDTLARSPGDSRSVNIVDVNGDGWDDVFITNGPQGGENNMLFINNGDGTFTRIWNDTIVKDHSPSDGATFADVDNDGDLDCYVVTWYNQKNYFYLNNGDGTFTRPGIYPFELVNTYSETASWGDYDGNGWVDLYITNSAGNQKNLLYRNDGMNQGVMVFTKIDNQPPVAQAKTSRSANWVDVNNDGKPDLFVSHESNELNDLFINMGGGNFQQMSGDPLVTALASSISSSWGDVDNDGDMDVVIANSGNFQPQNNMLFLNNGDGSFTRVTTGDLVNDGGCSYGSTMYDMDNDGDLDIFITNGFCNGVIKNFYYRNEGNGIFVRDTTTFPDLTTPASYGVACGDLNNDGWPDVVVATCKNTSQSPNPVDLVYYSTPGTNHWLKVKLTGIVSNRSAIGARIKVKAMISGVPVWQTREVSSQTGYCGQNSLTQHFGLKDALIADSLIVYWPSGLITVLTGIAAGQTISITETSSSGVDLHKAGKAKVYPNPTSGRVTIVSEEKLPVPSSLFMTDVFGRNINFHTVSAAGNSLVLDLHGLAGGVYFLRSNEPGRDFNFRIVVI